MMTFRLLPQLDSDGTITIEEQIVLVMKAKVQCELNITAQLQEGGNDVNKHVFSLCSSLSSSQKLQILLLSVREILSIILCFHVEGR